MCKDFIKKNSKVVLVDIKNYENTIQIEDNKFEDREEIITALNRLSDNERELIVMRYLDDMSLNDISKNTTMPLGTVKSKISRTLKKLRVYMEEV